MKRFTALVFAFLMIFSAVATTPSYAGVSAYKPTVLDNVYDWWTTLGKDGIEKERILAENKAERLKRYAEKQAEQMKKDAEKAGNDMKKKLGM